MSDAKNSWTRFVEWMNGDVSKPMREPIYGPTQEDENIVLREAIVAAYVVATRASYDLSQVKDQLWVRMTEYERIEADRRANARMAALIRCPKCNKDYYDTVDCPICNGANL